MLYEAREAEALPDSARAALDARAIDVATFFSPRAADAFVQLVTEAGLAETCRAVTAIAISPAAAQPLGAPCRLPAPSRQSVPPARRCWMRSTACPRPAYKARTP